MTRLPRVTGKDAVRALRRLGFEAFDQTGSHVYLHRRDGDRFGPRVTIPVHAGQILKPKTLQAILAAAGVSADEFRETV
ncbi:MAG: type II toxin-antitoxin system HicA family toxin [Elusimicrobia bacterium]|nr:type II toxin-antitoxin system HicA family toxin [Elusimicrobiota bacterium]